MRLIYVVEIGVKRFVFKDETLAMTFTKLAAAAWVPSEYDSIKKPIFSINVEVTDEA